MHYITWFLKDRPLSEFLLWGGVLIGLGLLISLLVA
jgi:hypothetical protein